MEIGLLWPSEHHKGAELPNPVNQPRSALKSPFSIQAFLLLSELLFLDFGHVIDWCKIFEIDMYSYLS